MERTEGRRIKCRTSTRVPLPRAHCEAVQAVETFQTLTPPAMRDVVEAMATEVRRTRQRTRESNFDANMLRWIPNMSSTNARETKYCCIVELYWHMKALLGRTITENKATFNDLCMQIEFLQLQIQALVKKITIMAGSFGIRFEDPNVDIHQVPKESDTPVVNDT
jgi:hypothetical protein